MTIRVVFMGSPEFAAFSLRYLLDNAVNVVGVVTRPDRPKGRGRKLSPTPVKEIALLHEIPVITPERLADEDFILSLKAFESHLFTVVAFRILPPSVFSLPRLGTVNLHASLLPRYRGAAPINWAIINGEPITGLTTFSINEGLDTGGILLQTEIPIGENETAGELLKRMANPGAELLLKTVRGLENGKLKPILQKESKASSAPKLKKSDGRINWDRSARSIHNLVRGINPWPGTYCFFAGKLLKIHRTSIVEEKSMDQPGWIIKASGKEGIVIQTGQGKLELLEVQPEGKRTITGAEWVRGYRIRKGDFLE